MRKIALSALWMALVSVSMVAEAKPASFLEQFALAPDRDVPLKQLIPGTRDYYYYHALHQQNQGKFTKVEEIVKRWRLRYRHDSRRTEIENRQALLRYNTQPKKSLAYLIKKLNITLQHNRSIAVRKKQYPSSMPTKKYTQEALGKKILSKTGSDLSPFAMSSHYWLSQQTLSGEQRRILLQGLKHPGYPGLVKMVMADLNYRYSRGFGSVGIHRHLTLVQLNALLKLKADLLTDNDFVNIYLAKLRPNPEENWKNTPSLRKAYLQRLWSFIKTLGPGYNSLKLNILYHQLKMNMSQGIFAQETFIDYIQLPRYASYINPKYVQGQSSRSYVANLSTGYSSLTGLKKVGNDEPLVRAHLMHFFQKEGGYTSYGAYIKDSYLKVVFAETKLLHGIGDAETWYQLLEAPQVKALKERVILRFAPTNKKRFATEDKVSLQLVTKNVETLLVKVYQINANNVYRKKGQEVRADLNLDGLVANEERVFKYNEAPIRLSRRTFSFPKLTRRGIYIIDFIGNGKNIRAMIRKGQLRFLHRMSVSGHVLTVLNEKGQLAPNPYVWMANRKYNAGKDGTIRIPFTRQQGWKPIILGSGDFVSLARLYQRREQYIFSASFFVDREALLARKKATVLIRPSLFVNRTSASTKLLTNVTLSMTGIDRFGVRNTRKVEDFKLYDNKESSYTFRVPEDLSSLQFTLSVQIKNITLNTTETQTRSKTFPVNQLDRTAKLATFVLTQSEGNYFVDLLDRTGQAWPNRVVTVKLRHKGFQSFFSERLQTDDEGRISLGDLQDIQKIYVRTAGGIHRSWTLHGNRNVLPLTVQSPAGKVITLPYSGQATKILREEFALFEKRNGTYVANHFSALSLQQGLVVIKGLPAGDYELITNQAPHKVSIRISKGKKVSGHFVGSYRTLEMSDRNFLQISGVQPTKKMLQIQLVNSDDSTRVHVVATRYIPQFHAFNNLMLSQYNNLSRQRWAQLSSMYLGGRNIGDEYRYILERKYAKKYPGNMLHRPALLLNPWAIRKTQTRTETLSATGAFAPPADQKAGDFFHGRTSGGKADRRPSYWHRSSSLPNLDFLPETSVTLYNLKPNKKGVVDIKLSQLRGHHLVHIVAVDANNTAYRRLSLKEQPLKPRDLRLRANLSSKKHFTQQSAVAQIKKGNTFKLNDITTSKFEVIDSLTKVHALFSTLNRDQNLQTFRFVLKWPTLTQKEKLDKYSEYACHELHYFLFRKDPTFFQKVVLPYLKNKKDKTFMDHWFLGADLKPYVQPWSYRQLNVVERILLAQRLKSDRANTQRHLRELFELIQKDLRRERTLFDTVLKLSDFQTSGYFITLQSKIDKLRTTRDETIRMRDGEKPNEKQKKKTGAFDFGAKFQLNLKKPRVNINGLKKMEGSGERDKRKKWAYDNKQRAQLALVYQPLEKTKEWVENNYYHLPIHKHNGSLILINAFWNDYAQHDTDKPFSSKHVNQATKNFSEMMFALSVLDLPFVSPKHKTSLKKYTMTLTAGGDLVVFYKAIQEAKIPKVKTPILVSQSFYEHGRKHRYIRGRKVEHNVSKEFLARKVYGCQVVVTNPTGTHRKLELLVQIPQGAIAVLNGKVTYQKLLHLGAYQTQRFNYYFYFPKAGQYDHFPVHVSRNGELVAFASSLAFKVVNKPTVVDKKSWDYMSQEGTLKEVLAYLSSHNLQRTSLQKIAWRMSNPKAFQSVLALLRQNHIYHQVLWSYGFMHKDLASIRDVLQHREDFLRRLGDTIASPLLTIHPVVRKTYQHMEYWPLVNARAHLLQKKKRITNNRLAAQYTRFVKILSYMQALSPQDKLATSYYLLLQDRVTEAMMFFDQVNAKALATQLQYDYFKIYMSFYRGALKVARNIALKYQNYPVVRWSQRFANALQQLDEIEGKAQKPKVVNKKSRDQKQTNLASKDASFQFNIKNHTLVISHRNINAFQIQYYKMDIELLFSRSPFVQKHSEQFAYIQPNLIQKVQANDKAKTTTVALPKAFHNSNVMIEITAAGLQRAKAHYSSSLDIQITPNYGQLKVSTSENKALFKVYVKVYARLKNGSIVFYKDGYTDLRGRFDYTSLSTNMLNQVRRFSMLLLSPQHGATVREVLPPKQ